MKKEIRCWLFILLIQLTWFPWVLLGTETEHESATAIIEEEWDLIRWKQEESCEETLEVLTYEKLQDMD